MKEIKLAKTKGVKVDKYGRSSLVWGAVNDLLKNEDSDYYYHSTGDSMGLAVKSGDEILYFDLKIRRDGIL